MTAIPPSQHAESWPALPLAEWEDTRSTLQLWTQMVGKTMLALAPMQNHWWQVALGVTPRGLTTPPLPHGERTLELEFDFIDHQLVARTSDGGIRTLALEPQAVADFYRRYREMLRALDADARIWPQPIEIANAIPFDRDREHVTYDAAAAQRFWRVLVQVDRVLRVFRGRFVGKCSPVHVWWGGLDVSCTRFSGRRAPTHPGGIPTMPDRVTREAYSHECISVGWWPGGSGTPILEPAFYAYAYPEPPGCPEAVVRPAAARYDDVLHEWILPYAAVRVAADPDAAVLDFAQSTYEAAAELGGWDRGALERH
jgi:hypothetical protein